MVEVVHDAGTSLDDSSDLPFDRSVQFDEHAGSIGYGGAFADDMIHVVSSATLRGRNLVALAKTLGSLGAGYLQARSLIARLKPAVVIGFGGYPTVPPVLAAAWSGVPSLIHDSNAVIGRANRFLAPRVTAIATTFPDVFRDKPDLAAKAVLTGNPVRAAVIAATATPSIMCAVRASIADQIPQASGLRTRTSGQAATPPPADVPGPGISKTGNHQDQE